MKVTPLIFSTDMIRALLDGRKTQARLPIKNVFSHLVPALGEYRDCIKDIDGMPSCIEYRPSNWEVCPYGQPGDLLWVREAFAIRYQSWHYTDGHRYRIDYKAGGPAPIHPYKAPRAYPRHSHTTDGELAWAPSIHMPRWASRITLRITDVRVQRVQDISNDDITHEGMKEWPPDEPGTLTELGEQAIRGSFHVLWDCINASRGHLWESNPWVWALTFEVIQANVDDVLKESAHGAECS